MIIRDFKLSDLDDVAKIEFNAFPDPYPLGVLLQLHDIGAGFLVAEVGHKIIGYIIFWIKENVGHIIVIAVDENFQNMHVGSALLENALKIFKRNEIFSVKLEVRKSNTKARNFYQRNGFTQVDFEENYYNDGEDAIIMQYFNHNN